MKTLLMRFQRSIAAIVVTLGLAAGSFVAPQAASADVTPSLATASSIGYQLFLMLNAERTANHLTTYTSNPYLRASAHAHNLMMARYDTMSHQLPGEMSLGARIYAAHYNWAACGENIAFNTDWSLSGAKYLQTLMYNEVAPNNGHRLNILSRTFHNVGVDVYMDSAHHRMWITFDFGVWK